MNVPVGDRMDDYYNAPDTTAAHTDGNVTR